MDRIIPICKLFSAAAIGAAAIVASPASAIKPDNKSIESFAHAWAAEVTENDAEAAGKYLALLNKNPSNPSVSARLWESSIRAGDRAKALRAARALELQGGVSEAALLIFGDALQKRDWKSAAATIKSLKDGNNYSFAAPLFAAWLSTARGRPTAFSVPADNNLLRFYSGDQPAYLALASGDMAKAKSSLSALASVDTGHVVDLRVRAAPVMAANGEQEFSRTLLQGLVPNDIIDTLSASRQRRELAKFAPEDGLSAFYTRLANALIEQGAPEKSLVIGRIATWLSPENVAAKLVLARALGSVGLGSKAGKILTSIDEKSPYWARAISDEIRGLSKAGKHSEAVTLATKALARRNSADLGVLLGQVQEAAGEFEKARATYAKLANGADAARIAPQRRAVFYLYLATVTHKLGDWQAARQLLEKGQALDPQNAYLSNYFGYSLLERKERLGDALEMLQRAHRLAPASMAIADSLGWGYYLTGDYSNAVKYLEKAARGSGSDLTINEHLGDAYWLSGRFIDARYAWRVAALGAEGDDAERLTNKISLGLESSDTRQN
ncbi:MAG: hypothetical protein V3V15_06930 [Sphingorhabdus sp.]